MLFFANPDLRTGWHLSCTSHAGSCDAIRLFAYTVIILLQGALSTTATTASRRPSSHQQQPGSPTLPIKSMLLILASWIFHDLCQPGLLLVFHPTLLLPSFEWQTVPLANSQAHIGHLYLPSSCCICLKYSPHSLLVKCLLVFKCFPLHKTLKNTLPQPTLFLSLSPLIFKDSSQVRSARYLISLDICSTWIQKVLHYPNYISHG